MERERIASKLRNLAGLLRSRLRSQSTIDRYSDELRQALTELREILPANDTLRDFIKAVLWDCCCLSSDGRAAIIESSVLATVSMNAEQGLGVRWQDIAQLPAWDDASYDRMADGLEGLAEKLTEEERAATDLAEHGTTWITVTEAAREQRVEKHEITRAANSGQIRTNGKSGHARRIDAASLVEWNLRRAEQ